MGTLCSEKMMLLSMISVVDLEFSGSGDGWEMGDETAMGELEEGKRRKRRLAHVLLNL